MNLRVLKSGKVENFCTLYYIDPDGNVYDVNYKPIERFLDNKGYLAVKLYINKDGEKYPKTFRIHKLVADNFICKNGNDYIYQRDKVFNISRDKTDVGVDNLLWCNYNEINAAMIYIRCGIEKCISYMTKHKMSIDEMNHVLFDTGFEYRIFKKRFVKKAIEKYGYTEEELKE